MKIDSCEAITVFVGALLPVSVIAILAFQFGPSQVYARAFIGLALMTFIALVVLWIVTRLKRDQNDNSDKVILTDDPENPAVEEIPNKADVLQTPIFTPIVSSMQRTNQPAFTPINSLPVITNDVNSSVSVIGVCPVHGFQQSRTDSRQDVTNSTQFSHT